MILNLVATPSLQKKNTINNKHANREKNNFFFELTPKTAQYVPEHYINAFQSKSVAITQNN